MACDGCSSTVADALAALPGVHKVTVHFESGLATIELQAPSQIDAFNQLPKLMEAVAAAGFEAEPYFGPADE
jgi:copper chaperone CopZ